jgi:hypothetical protein
MWIKRNKLIVLSSWKKLEFEKNFVLQLIRIYLRNFLFPKSLYIWFHHLVPWNRFHYEILYEIFQKRYNSYERIKFHFIIWFLHWLKFITNCFVKSVTHWKISYCLKSTTSWLMPTIFMIVWSYLFDSWLTCYENVWLFKNFFKHWYFKDITKTYFQQSLS